MAKTGKGEWVRIQGRANAALMLLARDMDAEFVAPVNETGFAAVRGRTAGCTFELRVAGAAPGGTARLVIDVRHFHAQNTYDLDGDGCDLPALEPQALRAAIEDACRRFAAASE